MTLPVAMRDEKFKLMNNVCAILLTREKKQYFEKFVTLKMKSMSPKANQFMTLSYCSIYEENKTNWPDRSTNKTKMYIFKHKKG